MAQDFREVKGKSKYDNLLSAPRLEIVKCFDLKVGSKDNFSVHYSLRLQIENGQPDR